MASEESHEVRVLLKQLEGDVTFLQRAPEISKVANYATDGFQKASNVFFSTPVGQNPIVLQVTSTLSSFIGAVCHYVKPRFNDMARHSAIQIYGEIFEFGERGIERRSAEDAPEFNEHRSVGTTTKTKDMFLKWIQGEKYLYSASAYRASSHNCHHFVQAACGFLNVPVPSSVQIILNWLQNGGNTVLEYADKIVGKSLSSGGAVQNTMTQTINSSPRPFTQFS